MGEIIKYKNQPGSVFAQIQLESGERLLISISTAAMDVKIFKLLWSMIPIKVICKINLKDATDLFLKQEDWGKDGILLDKIIETIIDCESSTDTKIKIEKLKHD